jgi:protein subunit release factor B
VSPAAGSGPREVVLSRVVVPNTGRKWRTSRSRNPGGQSVNATDISVGSCQVRVEDRP